MPRPQHSAMFGQRASSQIVFRRAPWMQLLDVEVARVGARRADLHPLGPARPLGDGQRGLHRVSLDAADGRPTLVRVARPRRFDHQRRHRRRPAVQEARAGRPSASGTCCCLANGRTTVAGRPTWSRSLAPRMRGRRPCRSIAGMLGDRRVRGEAQLGDARTPPLTDEHPAHDVRRESGSRIATPGPRASCATSTVIAPASCAWTGWGQRPAPSCRGQLLELELEDLRERLARGRAHLVDRHRPAELAGHRRERRVLEPAGGDPLRERRRVEVDVQRVAVRRHPAARCGCRSRRSSAAAGVEPDAGEPVDPRRLDAERGERADQRLLEVAAVALRRPGRAASGRGSGSRRAGPGPWKVDLPPRSVSTTSTSAPSGTCSSPSSVRRPSVIDRRVLEQEDRVRDRAVRAPPPRASAAAPRPPRTGRRPQVHERTAPSHVHLRVATAGLEILGAARASRRASPNFTPSCVARWRTTMSADRDADRRSLASRLGRDDGRRTLVVALAPALELLAQVAQEPAGVGAVDQAVVVREREVHDRPDRDHVLAELVLDDPRRA